MAGEPDAARRQETYLAALTAYRPEIDVALGVSMVKDAAQGYGDRSVLITTDTGLTPAINATAELAPDRPIYLACPPGRQPDKWQ